jgi:hypothetical protein
MKRLGGLLILLIGVLVLFAGCKSKKESSESIMASNMHKVEVKEFIQTTEYTYFRVKEGNAEYWMAAPKREQAKKGETLYYTTSWGQTNWKSPELGRTFDMVYFIQDLTDTPGVHTGTPSMGGSNVHMGMPRGQQDVINANTGPGEPEGVVEEEITIDELLKNTDKYANKIVKLTGKVIKVNPAIMARNWVHITAEPDDGNNYDLTLTTQDDVEVDQVIRVEGQVSLNRDFGAGYTYEVIVENAKLTSK